MKIEFVFVLILTLSIIFILNYNHTIDFHINDKNAKNLATRNEYEKMLLESAENRIKSKNISLTEESLVYDKSMIESLTKIINSKDQEMKKLIEKINELENDKKQMSEQLNRASANLLEYVVDKENRLENVIGKNLSATSVPKNSKITLSVEMSEIENYCEERFGLSLIDSWRDAKETWCEDKNENEKEKSELICYPYQQQHKKGEGRTDMFCEAKNFIIDFSKINGEAGNTKPPLGNQYHSFIPGSIYSSCRKTKSYKNNLFMPHHSLQMNTFLENRDIKEFDSVVDHPTYLLSRDEDCENTFHHSADLMNIFLVYNILGIKLNDKDGENSNPQIVLFDKHTDGPYTEFLQKVFSPSHPLIRSKQFSGKKVLFRHLIFHLESPAALIFPKVTKPNPNKCFSTSLFQSYRKHVLSSLNLWNVAPPPIPTITLTLRRRTEHKNVGRVMENENEIIQVLKEGNMVKVNVVDFATMNFIDQIKLVRETNVLVGVHGAGLMLIMFSAEESVLVELHPSYRQDRHFRHAARMTGKLYLPLRARDRETCKGSSDSVRVPVQEFRDAIDGAVRLARNFDGGLVECGLKCPSNILAMDPRLDKYYEKISDKGRSIDTSFPCG